MRWKYLVDKKERQASYSRMRLSSNRKLLQMALVTGCHSAVVYFPESQNITTFSTFGSFDCAVELYDATEEHVERGREALGMDFVELWDMFISNESGMPHLDKALEGLRALGVPQDTRSNATASAARSARTWPSTCEENTRWPPTSRCT